MIAGSSAGRDDYTAALVDRLGELAVHGVAVRPGHPVVLGAIDSTPVLGAPGYPVSASLTFDIFAAPLLAELEGAAATPRPTVRARLARKLASTIGMDDWVRVRLGRVGGALVASPLPRGAGVLTSLVRADGLLVVPSGVEGHHAGEEVEIELLRSLTQIERTIVAIGSHDMILDLAASQLRASDPERDARLGQRRIDGRADRAARRAVPPGRVAPARSGDRARTRCRTSIRSWPGATIAVVRLVHREQGLLVAPGNPLGLTGVADLARPGLRYVNRQRGAGTRVLLDYELARAGIDPDAIVGYGREEPTHLAVAAAIASGRADCGMGVLAAARAFGLDFVPVTKRALRPRARARRRSSTRCSLRSGSSSNRPGSGRRSRTSAATTPPRWAAGFDRSSVHLWR